MFGTALQVDQEIFDMYRYVNIYTIGLTCSSTCIISNWCRKVNKTLHCKINYRENMDISFHSEGTYAQNTYKTKSSLTERAKHCQQIVIKLIFMSLITCTLYNTHMYFFQCPNFFDECTLIK